MRPLSALVLFIGIGEWVDPCHSVLLSGYHTTTLDAVLNERV